MASTPLILEREDIKLKAAPKINKQKIDLIIEEHQDTLGGVLTILEEVQKITEHSFLPEEALAYISQKTSVPLSRIYNIVTFYSFFNLKPQGRHTITVCRGTACHTRGSKALLDEAAIKLGGELEMSEGEGSFTTPDNEFTIRTVACFGQCALAPVVAIDEEIHSNVSLSRLQELIENVSADGK